MNDTKTPDTLLTEGPISGKIIKYALPIFIGYLFQQFYNTADALIVGNLIGSSALAAVTGTGAIVFMAVGFFLGFSVGAGIVIARRIGALDHGRTSSAVHTTVAMGIAFSVLMTAAGVLLTPWVLRIMGTPDDVFPDASLYLRIYFAGSTGFVMYNTFVGILQASGDSKHPLYYLIICSLINIVLDVVFIAVFRMGVDGAALATVLSQCAAAVMAGRRLVRRDDSIRVRLSGIRFNMTDLREIVRYGLPTAGQNCVIDLSNVLIQSYINSFSSAAMAGIGAYIKAEGFAFLPVTAFSMAMSTFISQNMGAGEHGRVRKGARFGLLWTILITEAIGVVMFIVAPYVISAFNRDPQVIAYGVLKARISSLFFCTVGFSHVSSAVMRGLGRPVTPLLVMLICWCAVRVAVLSTIGQMYHDIRLACWIYPVTWMMSTVVYILCLRRDNIFGRDRTVAPADGPGDAG